MGQVASASAATAHRYDLYAIAANEMNKMSNDALIQFVRKVREISQERCPVRTGALKRSWYTKAERVGENKVKFAFGYSADHAMPADYATGRPPAIGDGFFSSSVKDAFEQLFGKKPKEFSMASTTQGYSMKQWKGYPKW
jgi:hypothetical protein